MKKTCNLLILCLILLFFACNGRNKSSQEFYDEMFKWRITIPENLDSVSPELWAKNQERAMTAIKNTYGGLEVEDNTITIFRFSKGQFNLFEAQYQDFDTKIDGNFVEALDIIYEMIYETLIVQAPNIVIDTIKTIEKIDNLDFYVFKMKGNFPNKMVLNMLMYSRLIDDKMFGVTITYLTEELGQKMINALKNSTFEK